MSTLLVLVVGTGRSGTSLAMQALEALGARVAPSQVPPSEDNPRGTGEDTVVRDLMTDLWRDLKTFATFRPQGWRTYPVVRDATTRLAAHLRAQAEAAKGAPLAAKYPTASMFLPLWREAAESAGLDLRLVWASRRLGPTLESFERSYGTTRSLALQRCRQRCYYVLRDASPDTLILRHADWHRDAAGQVRRLAMVAALAAEDVEAVADAVFRPGLDRSGAADLASDPALDRLDALLAELDEPTLHHLAEAAEEGRAGLLADLHLAMRNTEFFANEYGNRSKLMAPPEDTEAELGLMKIGERLTDPKALEDLARVREAIEMKFVPPPALREPRQEHDHARPPDVQAGLVTSLLAWSRRLERSLRAVEAERDKLAASLSEEAAALNEERRTALKAAADHKSELAAQRKRLEVEWSEKLVSAQNKAEEATAAGERVRVAYCAVVVERDTAEERAEGRNRVRLSKLEQQLANIMGQAKKSQNERPDRRSQLRAEKRSQQLEARVAELEQQLASAMAESKKLRDGRPDRKLRLLAEERSRQLDALLASTSWRVTRPLREVKNILSRTRSSPPGGRTP